MNKIKTYLVLLLIGVLVLGFTGVSFGQDELFEKDEVRTIKGPKWAPGEILVKFKGGISEDVIRQINQRYGTSILSISKRGQFMRLKIPRNRTVEEMVSIYSRNPNVEYAEPNFLAFAVMTPNDPYYSYQWHLDNSAYGGIHMESAWDISAGSGVTIAVIDTGIAYEDYQSGRGWLKERYYQAPDLNETCFVEGYDFVNDDTHSNDDNSHGTHVAGTIAQSTNNNKGVAGIAYQSCLMPVKVLDENGAGTYDDVADGIYFAADNGAAVINLSLGGTSPAKTLEDAVAYAYSKGVTIVCAAGNEYLWGNSPLYPAAYDAYCIAVGATRYDETRAYYSNTGSYLDIVAPGGDLYFDQNSDGYGDGVLQNTFNPNSKNTEDFGYWFFQGTSMASPHVAGVAALVIANRNATTPDEVRAALQETAEDKGTSGRDDTYGWGLVDAAAALGWTTAANNSPTADPDGPYLGTEDTAIAFDGSSSSDPDGDVLTYKWDFGDGTTSTVDTPTTIHTYTTGQAGADKVYDVSLIVNDGKVDSDPSTTTATITGVNDQPIADADGPYSGIVNEEITFNASDSSDEEGIGTYEWDFGDGNKATVTTATTTYAYSAIGTYNVVLTVTDINGATAKDTTTAKVTEVKVMYVGNIVMPPGGFISRGPNTWCKAIAVVTITDGNTGVVADATVSGNWSGAYTNDVSGTTDAYGNVTFETKYAKGGGTFEFCVTDITKTGWKYDSSKNVIKPPCDSITLTE